MKPPVQYPLCGYSLLSVITICMCTCMRVHTVVCHTASFLLSAYLCLQSACVLYVYVCYPVRVCVCAYLKTTHPVL